MRVVQVRLRRKLVDGRKAAEVELSAATVLELLSKRSERNLSPLALVIHVFSKVFSQPGPPETIVIDEVNRLTKWGKEHADDRDLLLGFLVSVTKQKKKAHVILASSGSATQEWLNGSALCCPCLTLQGTWEGLWFNMF